MVTEQWYPIEGGTVCSVFVSCNCHHNKLHNTVGTYSRPSIIRASVIWTLDYPDPDYLVSIISLGNISSHMQLCMCSSRYVRTRDCLCLIFCQLTVY